MSLRAEEERHEGGISHSFHQPEKVPAPAGSCCSPQIRIFEQKTRSGGAGAGAEQVLGKCHPYHPAGTPGCGTTGTWSSGPRSSCHRAGVWGCHSGDGRIGCHPHSSWSRSPTHSTGPSHHPLPPIRGQEKLLKPSLSLSCPSCSLAG